MSNHPSAIIARHLALGYPDHPVQSNINLDIQKGEFIAILGPNGSGKSTFLRAILGLIKPLSGELLICENKKGFSNKQIGYMPQIRSTLAIVNLTSFAMLNAAYDGTRYGVSFKSKTKKEEIMHALALVKALPLVNRPIWQLSGGERQRVYLAQSLLQNPQILLLDEPLSNLDPQYQETFIHILTDIQKKYEVTILFTAHDPNPLLNVMSRVLFFGKGKSIIGSVNDIITSQTLSTLYGTPIEVIHHNNRLFVLGDGHNILGQGAHHHD